MLSRLTGILESLDGNVAILRVGQADLAVEVLVPGYLVSTLASRTGQSVTFQTLFYLEGQGQGTSFIPRIIGFGSTSERAFFELFTTVKGIGNKKALRALAETPGVIAAAIARRDARALTELPEIGKRMAETIVAELYGKVDAFALDAALGEDRPRSTIEARAGGPGGAKLAPALEDAVSALCALGETRADAERKVSRAIDRSGNPAPAHAEGVLALVYALR